MAKEYGNLNAWGRGTKKLRRGKRRGRKGRERRRRKREGGGKGGGGEENREEKGEGEEEEEEEGQTVNTLGFAGHRSLLQLCHLRAKAVIHNKWVSLSSNKTSFTKISRSVWPEGQSLLISCLRKQTVSD